MAGSTPIEWTEKSWNPGRGCSRVSPGCDHCYAMKIAYRFKGEGLAYEGLATLRNGKADWTGVVKEIPDALDAPLHWRDPKLIFVNSQTDLFHQAFENEFIASIFGVMAATPHHRYQILTKRAERMRDWFLWLRDQGGADDQGLFVQQKAYARLGANFPKHAMKGTLKAYPWPLQNVMLGVSCETQQYADERIPFLLQTPAAARMVSIEPQLGPVDLDAIQIPDAKPGLRFSALKEQHDDRFGTSPSQLDWVVDGGESDSDREYDINWGRSLRDQCRAAGVAFFMKQCGTHPVEGGVPLSMKDPKGGDPSEWPEDLRVREYPRGFAPRPPKARLPEPVQAIPVTKKLASTRSYSVFRTRPDKPDAIPDKIWSFEAKSPEEARRIFLSVIPEAELPRCALVKDRP